MEIANLTWHDYLNYTSFLASIAGLVLILNASQTQAEEIEETERMLLLMSFTYWSVYCVAVGLQKFQLPESEILFMSLQLTAIISYLLTFCCILILPLHRFASRYVE